MTPRARDFGPRNWLWRRTLLRRVSDALAAGRGLDVGIRLWRRPKRLPTTAPGGAWRGEVCARAGGAGFRALRSRACSTKRWRRRRLRRRWARLSAGRGAKYVERRGAVCVALRLWRRLDHDDVRSWEGGGARCDYPRTGPRTAGHTLPNFWCADPLCIHIENKRLKNRCPRMPLAQRPTTRVGASNPRACPATRCVRSPSCLPRFAAVP